ncbi:MAG: hypothetical protein WDA60_08130 [Acidimicrobiia bacterium]|jgi:hypothetical protein
MANRLNRFDSDLTKVIVQHGIVGKLIGDSVMGLSFPPLSTDGQIMMSEAVAKTAAVPDGQITTLDLKGKAEPVPACVVTVGR